MQGFNRYFPPDFDPEKHVTLNNYHGKHALGVRAHKLKSGGGLIVRFELPFNIWCGGCDAHIGQGVRFNAEKIKVGNYYSTPIYEFKCKCHVCAKQIFTIQTDPKNTRYVVTSGARQKNEEWDPEEVGGMPIRDDSGKVGDEDAFAAVEKDRTDKANALSSAQRLDALEVVNDDRWADPYTQSRRLRDAFRREKKARVAVEARDTAIRERYGLSKELKLDTDRPEQVRAAAAAFQSGRVALQAEDRRKRRRIEAALGTAPERTSITSSASSSALDSLKSRLVTQSKLGTDAFLTSSIATPSAKIGRLASIRR